MTEPKEEKCEACCGDGYINFWTDDGHISMRTCRRCDGYGYIKVKQMTNEEWLRSCPPQELIRFLMNVAWGGQIRNVQKSTFDEEAEKWSKWLKEKHE